MSEDTAPDGMEFREFVALMASLIAMVALSIDAILPALGQIGTELGGVSENDRQLAIAMFFLGLACAQIFYGPVSDSFGRRPAIFLGLAIYLAGTALCLAAGTMGALVLGRIVQGVGAAGPRIVANAIIRDRYKGRPMARVTSLVMMIFIVVPVFAPLIGQGILMVAQWRAIFWLFAGLACLAFLWTLLRLPETHPVERRKPFRARPILVAMRAVFGNRLAMGCTLAMGMVFASFLAFLSASQQILGEAYALGELFPITFSALALVVGISSGVNSGLVMRFGMRRLSTLGILGIGGASLAFVVWSVLAGTPPLWAALLWLSVAVGSIGIVFGNLNAMAMEPLGEVAGVAAGAVASVASLISAVLGAAIARSYDGSALPVALGFFGCAIAALVFLRWADGGRQGGAQA